MVIELLKVKVPPKQREKYIQKDAEIWTTALAKYPRFLGKEQSIGRKILTETKDNCAFAYFEIRRGIKALMQKEKGDFYVSRYFCVKFATIIKGSQKRLF